MMHRNRDSCSSQPSCSTMPAASVMRGVGDVAIVDGFGGRTIARVRIGDEGLEVTGEDVERGREVAAAWVAWCKENGKAVW